MRDHENQASNQLIIKLLRRFSGMTGYLRPHFPKEPCLYLCRRSYRSNPDLFALAGGTHFIHSILEFMPNLVHIGPIGLHLSY